MANNKFDLIIMGAGLAGLLSAVEARKLGMSVLVLEAGRVEDSASAGLVGALAPHMPEHWNEKKEYQFQSMQMAESFWREVKARTGLPTGYQRLGRLQMIKDEREFDKAKMREDAAKTTWRGLANWTVEDRAHPFIGGMSSVIYDDLSAQIFPKQAMLALKKYAEQIGVDLREHQSIHRFEKGQVFADEIYHCDKILIAGGYQAWPFLRPFFGAEFGEGTKGQAALLALDEAWYYPMLTGDGFYIVPHEPRLLGVGSTSERYWKNREIDRSLDDFIARISSDIKLPAFRIVARWAGIRPRAYRPDPLIGQVEDGVYISAGGFKTGFSFGNKIAYDLARMITGNTIKLPSNFDATNHLQSD